ncbi:NR LBD domain-containing protein [Caenorhabditis elegans]|uniref:NR LBD domain-containing protein n=1 Tax=Caenorhabditis elegans TaxID=6239 RepID=G5EFJ1_CAEEL|nr:NR LBD domain-containing protein [Caenorhabditis elegans]CAA92777.2 NR LBD domain-containing protein [Caenorhabditis elegans]|eukprot:NP_501666.1 Uncharacterized protein CELE_F38E11.9 [Caenorhabditis elegans]
MAESSDFDFSMTSVKEECFTEDFFNSIKSMNTKRRKTYLTNLMSSNELTKRQDTNPDFDYFSYQNVNFSWIRCRNCLAIIVDERCGNRYKHKNKECTATIMLPDCIPDYEDLTSEITDFCLKSGLPFSLMASENFQNFLKNVCLKSGHPDVGNITFPTRETIQNYICADYEHIIESIGLKIRKKVKCKEANLLIDLGKYYHDYLNALVLYMDDGLEKLELQVVPYAFKMTSSSKSAIHMKELLVQAGEKFGLSPEDVTSMTLISDDTENMKNKLLKTIWSLLPKSIFMRFLHNNLFKQ